MMANEIEIKKYFPENNRINVFNLVTAKQNNVKPKRRNGVLAPQINGKLDSK